MVIFLFLFISLIILKNGGIYLVKNNSPHSCDAMIILMGSITDRVVEANDLWHENKSCLLLIVNHVQIGSEYIESLGVKIPNSAQLSKQALVQLGIPDSSITIIPGSANSTKEEADILAQYLKKQDKIRSLVIVSSAYHTRRAYIIFKNRFRNHKIDVNIYTSPSKYSEFNEKYWWKDRESAKVVISEYSKLVGFILADSWR